MGSTNGAGSPRRRNLPGGEPDVTYAYDNLSRLTSASQTGNALSFTYDALSRNLTQVGPQGTISSQWDVAGRRTKLTYPGSGLYIDYDYLVTGEMVKLKENGATSGVGVLATIAYDDLGRRSSLTRGNGTATTYAYDPISRLATLGEDMASTANDQSTTFSYNPASQIASLTKTNDAYAWTGHGNGSTASVANGLNQLTSIGGTATSHDARGNLTSDPTTGKTLAYSSENLLTSATGGTSATLSYDPAMRLTQIVGAATTKLQYDGVALIAEYDGAGTLTKRYVHGPGIDEPLVEYDASATRHWLHADERGSVIAQTDATGAVTQINKYDEFGKPQSTNVGRFQYTGQTWLNEVGAYYYKARFYSPTEGGRFYQTDPIGTAGGINLYAYVGNDPVNYGDSTGLSVDLPPQRRYCTGSILLTSDCSHVGFLSVNGQDTQAAEMVLENYVDANTWVDSNGSPVSSATALAFIKGHGGWHEMNNGLDIHVSWFENVQLAGVSPNFYRGEQYGALHWYSDAVVGGYESWKRDFNRGINRIEECLENLNGAEVVVATAEGMVTGTVFTALHETSRGKPPRNMASLTFLVVRSGASGAARNIGKQCSR